MKGLGCQKPICHMLLWNYLSNFLMIILVRWPNCKVQTIWGKKILVQKEKSGHKGYKYVKYESLINIHFKSYDHAELKFS